MWLPIRGEDRAGSIYTGKTPHSIQNQLDRSMPFPFLSKSADFNKSLKLPSACEVFLVLPWKLLSAGPPGLLQGNQELRLSKIDGLTSGSGSKVDALDSLRMSVGFADMKECTVGETAGSSSSKTGTSSKGAVDV